MDISGIIEKLERIENPIFLCPRRFGKSLWCRILECYYNIGHKEQFDTLFGHTYIGRNPTSLHNALSSVLYADIATDGSVGPAQAIPGPNFTIPQTLGTLSGSNLFHSFRTFSISKNQSAAFTGSDAIDNVISRVTGGEVSTIDGLLRSTVGQADFFFINPSGIVFGPNAKVDVPAAFHVSTANELFFDDGSVFNASFPESSTLTQAAPESFGFLGAQSAAIEINGSRLEFVPESTISLSSSDIIIQPFEKLSLELSPALPSKPALLCEKGNIQLTAVGSTSVNISLNEAISLNGSIPLYENISPDKTVSVNADGLLVIDSAELDVSGNDSGSISIRAGNALISTSLIILG